jgi:hypothetical protein
VIDEGRSSRQPTRPRRFVRHPWYWLTPALGPAALVWVVRTVAAGTGRDADLAWWLVPPSAVLAALTYWHLRRSIRVDDGGITDSTRRGRRVLAWDEVEMIVREDDPVELPIGRGRRAIVYTVKARGGRRLRFTTASVLCAETLARLIHREIWRRRGVPRATGGSTLGSPSRPRIGADPHPS